MSLTHNTVEHVSIGVVIHVLHCTVGIDENRLNLPISEIGRVFNDEEIGLSRLNLDIKQTPERLSRSGV